MRLFVALDLPDPLVAGLEKLIDTLRPTARIQWSKASNLHITLKFIGEWKEERLEKLKAALAKVPPCAPIEVRIGDLGFLPNARQARIFHCAVVAPGIEALATGIERATSKLGIENEKRRYSPHLTLARNRDRTDVQRLRETIAGGQAGDLPHFTADQFFLYQSKLQPGGSVYTKLAEFPFSH